jgi:hypothetical protein
VADQERVWTAFRSAIGADGAPAPGTAVRLSVPGLPAVERVVEFVHEPSFLGLRTADSIFMLIHGYRDAVEEREVSLSRTPEADGAPSHDTPT